MSVITLPTADAVEVRELFVRAVAEHEGLRLYETPTAVWVERFPGLIYMAQKSPAMGDAPLPPAPRGFGLLREATDEADLTPITGGLDDSTECLTPPGATS